MESVSGGMVIKVTSASSSAGMASVHSAGDLIYCDALDLVWYDSYEEQKWPNDIKSSLSTERRSRRVCLFSAPNSHILVSGYGFKPENSQPENQKASRFLVQINSLI